MMNNKLENIRYMIRNIFPQEKYNKIPRKNTYLLMWESRIHVNQEEYGGHTFVTVGEM